jgi:hypothetical protein
MYITVYTYGGRSDDGSASRGAARGVMCAL